MTRLYKKMKNYHKWLALIFTLFFILFAFSGILMNHRTLISGIDVNRKWLPKSYKLQNWNLASVKSAVEVAKDSIIIYGGAGIWLTNNDFISWKPFMDGLPKGSDRRKIFDFIKTPNGDFYAGTRFGLYKFSKGSSEWRLCSLPENDQFVTALEVADSKLLVLTRNHLYQSPIDAPSFLPVKVELIPPAGSKPNITIFRLFWIIHSGELYGIAGRLIVDLVGLTMIFLCITGLIFFFFPKIIKRAKAKKRLSRMKKVTKFSYNWHLKIGIYSSLFLLVVSFTGIFLRPPFLLMVVNGKVNQSTSAKTINEVFWHDKFRDIKYDQSKKLFLLATSDGIFYNDDNFANYFKTFDTEPPISVMGINVFEILDNSDYLIGSFSGAFQWNPFNGTVVNYITGEPIQQKTGLSSPFGSLAIAGYTKINNQEFFFDYDKGVIAEANSKASIQMPKVVKDNFPFPLWNFAQEIHTCRIYSPIISDFYILIVPLAGLAMLVITITGVIMWFLKKKTSDTRHQTSEKANTNNEQLSTNN